MSDTQEVALFGLSKDMPDFLADTDFGELGNEGVGPEDIAVPQLKILQGQSPELNSVEGATPGKFLNSVTNELMETVLVVNIAFVRQFVVFRKRTAGGGKVGAAATRAEAMELINEQGEDVKQCDIVETGIHKLLALDSKTGEPSSPMVLYCSSTRLTTSQRWNSAIKIELNGKPRFAAVWKLSPKKESNSKGSWFGFSFEFRGFAPEALFLEAKTLRDALVPQESPLQVENKD